MSDNIKSLPYRPDKACEKCVFGTGQHADWCHPIIGGSSQIREGKVVSSCLSIDHTRRTTESVESQHARIEANRAKMIQ